MKNVVLLILQLFLLSTICIQLVSCRQFQDSPIVKTIKAKNGDVIDCTDLFNEYRAQNHTIELEEEDAASQVIHQIWHKSGRCPLGTVAILRTTQNKSYTNSLFPGHVHGSGDLKIQLHGRVYHAGAYMYEGPYRGAKGTMSIWNPNVMPEEFSFGHITLLGTGDPNYESGMRPTTLKNMISIGWAVFPGLFKDSKTRLFVFWSKDVGVATGCFNLDCPGFVPISNTIAVGAELETSVYGGKTVLKQFAIEYVAVEERWYVIFEDIRVGYLEPRLFTFFYDCDAIRWGGSILNSRADQMPTPTTMGNDHFAEEGNMSAMINECQAIDENGAIKVYQHPTEMISDRKSCYNSLLIPSNRFQDGFYISYGGPGSSSSTCE